MKPAWHGAGLGLLVTVLAGCAAPSGGGAPIRAAEALPPQWQAPLPHQGRIGDLSAWWAQFDDPLLTRLIAAAQQVSPNVASAASRIEQSRAVRIAAGAGQGPTLDMNGQLMRGAQDLGAPAATTASFGLQASWELDLFGGQRAATGAAQARLESAQAAWHDARVSVAAEVASRYTALRACEAQLVLAQADTTSRAETAHLTGLASGGGFRAPSDAALARASAAQGRAELTQRRTQCELDVKALVALTGITEPTLREAMAATRAQLPRPAQIAIDSVPAQALAQRPDLIGAERELVAASADVSQAQAQRLPRVSLSGSIAAARAEAGPVSSNGTLWTIGPLAVSLPIFDGGTRRANVEAARARHAEAASTYRAKLRGAVREVEEALVTLQGTADRSGDAQGAADGFHAAYLATEARQRGGLASLFELEDARRSDLQAQTALIDLQREQVLAWIGLYRALGGDWSANDTGSPPPH